MSENFDIHAKNYDTVFTYSQIGKAQRNRVYHFLNKDQTPQSINQALDNLRTLIAKKSFSSLGLNDIIVKVFGKDDEVNFIMKTYKKLNKHFELWTNQYADFLENKVRPYIHNNPKAKLKDLFREFPELSFYKLVIPKESFLEDLKKEFRKGVVERMKEIYSKYLDRRNKLGKVGHYLENIGLALALGFMPPIISKLVKLKVAYDSNLADYNSLYGQRNELVSEINNLEANDPGMPDTREVVDVYDTYESAFLGVNEPGMGTDGIDEEASLTDPSCPYYVGHETLTADCILYSISRSKNGAGDFFIL